MRSKNQSRVSSAEKIKRMVLIALFCAIAYVAMFVFKINVTFLTFDVKDAIIAVCGLIFGPVASLVTSFTVAFLELITVSDTGFYGFFMNFLSSAVFSCSVALIYKYFRKFSGAIIGLAVAIVSTVIVMLAFNMLVTPLFMKVDRSVVYGMIPTILLPFNLVKSVFNASLTLFLYKPVSVALKSSGAIKVSEEQKNGFTRRQTIAATVLAVLFIVLSIAVFILLLDGNISWF